MTIDEGLLDRRIFVERAMQADDGYNETAAWTLVRKVWAQFMPSRGREAREQLGREAQLAASFRIRWSAEMAAIEPGSFRIRYPAQPDGQIWDIKSVVEIGRREGIEIVALARSGATA